MPLVVHSNQASAAAEARTTMTPNTTATTLNIASQVSVSTPPHAFVISNGHNNDNINSESSHPLFAAPSPRKERSGTVELISTFHKKLPPDWLPFRHIASGKIFFWNKVTDESRWTLPAPMNEFETAILTMFRRLEEIFFAIDYDRIGIVPIRQLCRWLATAGADFQTEEFHEFFTIFERDMSCDVASSVDFSGFLVFAVMWTQAKPFSSIFPTFSAVVDDMTDLLRSLWSICSRYRSEDGKYSSAAVARLQLDNFPSIEYRSRLGIHAVESTFSEHGGGQLGIRGILLLIYRLFCPQQEALRAPQDGDKNLFRGMLKMFSILEEDYQSLQGNKIRLLQSVSGMHNGCELVDILSLVRFHLFKILPATHSTLSFPQFVALMMGLVNETGYCNIVPSCKQPSIVKLNLLKFSGYLPNPWPQTAMAWEDVSAFFFEAFGHVPSGGERIFVEMCANSSGVGPIKALLPFIEMLHRIMFPGSNLPYSISEDENIPTKLPDVAEDQQEHSSHHVRPPKFNVIDPTRIQDRMVVGRCQSGTLIRAKYLGFPVMIKMAKSLLSFHRINQAAKIMGLFNHDHIVSLVGRLQAPDNVYYILAEACDNGSLFDLIARDRYALPFSIQLRIAHNIAMGLLMLHSHHPPFVHTSLSSRHVLLDSDFRARLSSLGSICDAGGFPQPKGAKVPCQWSAPELLLDSSVCYHPSQDIYSFGVVLWEICHHRVPFDHHDYHQVQLRNYIIKLNYRPRIDISVCDARLARCIQNCWNLDHTKRPSTNQIVEYLQSLQLNPSASDPSTLPQFDKDYGAIALASFSHLSLRNINVFNNNSINSSIGGSSFKTTPSVPQSVSKDIRIEILSCD